MHCWTIVVHFMLISSPALSDTNSQEFYASWCWYFPSTSTIVKQNFQGIYSHIEKDLERSSNVPNSLQARIAIVKIDVLPLRPRLKLTTLQWDKTQGGLALPKFKIYFWSFVLRPLSIWCNPNSSVSWRPIEENLSPPLRLQDLVYSTKPLKKARLCLGTYDFKRQNHLTDIQRRLPTLH